MRTTVKIAQGFLGATLLWSAGATASEPAPVDEPAPLVSGERYVGVVPGAAGKNPLPLPKPVPPQLVWTGFKAEDGRSVVFFQTTRPVTYEVKPSTDGAGRPRLSVFLRNCRIHLQNNRRTLDTRFFATPVAGVQARQRRKDVELEIALKEPVDPKPRTEAGPDGTHFLVLEFPPGQAASTEPSVASHRADGPAGPR